VKWFSGYIIFEIIHVQVNRLSLPKYVNVTDLQNRFKIHRNIITSGISELLPQFPFYEPPLFDSLTLHFFAPQRPQQPQQPTIQHLPNYSEWPPKIITKPFKSTCAKRKPWSRFEIVGTSLLGSYQFGFRITYTRWYIRQYVVVSEKQWLHFLLLFI
jgi:hypothetical protein